MVCGTRDGIYIPYDDDANLLFLLFFYFLFFIFFFAAHAECGALAGL